jgi:Zn-dependent M28 family amino/carboxypeptidase
MPRPGRTIVFMAVTGGESGLAGSSYYTDNPLFPLQDTVADINLDTLHIGGPTRDVTIFGFGQSELEGYVRSAAVLQGRELHADPDMNSGSYYRSDTFSFALHGVPALYAIGGTDDAARGPQWGRSQLQDYYLHRYHRPQDVYSPDWDLRGTADDLRLYYRVGLMLSQGGRFPNWLRNSEFREQDAQDRGG